VIITPEYMRTNLQSYLVEEWPAIIQKLEKIFAVLELNRTKTHVKILNKLNREHMAKTNSGKRFSISNWSSEIDLFMG